MPIAQIDAIVSESYGLDEDSVARLGIALTAQVSSEKDEDDSDDSDVGATTDIRSLVSDLIACCVGTVFGRWDVRLLGNEDAQSKRSTPFSLLPQLPPLSLKDSNESSLKSTPSNYPIHINWDGIGVDSPNHQVDLVGGVQAVLESVWKDRAETVEKEICDLLAIKNLRDYFGKAGKGGFWRDHIARHSKSRRKAPIYWLLQSANNNYGLWLYYHRLDKDLLFKALVNYVEPKIRLETNRLGTLRSQKAAAGETGKESKRLAKEVEQQEDFISELRDFEDKLRRAANLHLQPDLNDGVVLNIAPLHELVPWNEAQSYWEELLKGEYAWSSIAKQLRQKGLVK